MTKTTFRWEQDGSGDLQKFCATDTDPRAHIRKPTRCAEGIVATNGQILICVPDDGRECDSTKDTICLLYTSPSPRD